MGRGNPQARYQVYMKGHSNDALEAFYKGPKIPPLLGNEHFKAKLLTSIPQYPDIPERRQAQPRPSLKTVTAVVARYYGVPKTQIFSPTRGKGVKTPARSLAMYVCQDTGGMTLATIADEFGLSSYASAGGTIRNSRRRLAEDKGLTKDLMYILQDLTPIFYLNPLRRPTEWNAGSVQRTPDDFVAAVENLCIVRANGRGRGKRGYSPS